MLWQVVDPGSRASAVPHRRVLRPSRRCWLAHALLVAPLVALTGCGLWRPVSVPMAALPEPARCATPADTLLVMLPGSFARPEEFAREGFVRAVRERQLAVDMVLVDAHLGYYSDRSIIDRLQADIVAPARARGYRSVWLVGISVGAFGALIHTQAQPEGITGIVALGPYLGKRSVTEQVRAAGGLSRWQAPGGVLAADEIDLILWRWLQGGRVDGSGVPVPLHLGYGLADRFLVDDELLAATLPAERVFTAEGGHDWPVWLSLWQRMLGVLPLRRDPTCAQSAAP